VFEARYQNDETGAPAYDPAILLKIILLAYARGVTSSRRIERLCRATPGKDTLTGGHFSFDPLFHFPPPSLRGGEISIVRSGEFRIDRDTCAKGRSSSAGFPEGRRPTPHA